MEDDRVILLNSSHDELELEAATFNTSSSKIGSPENDEQSAPDLDLPKSPGLLSEPAEPSWIVYVAAGVAAVGGFLFGYDMGIISGAKTQMQSELGLRCWHVGAVVAFLPVGAFVASLVGGIVVDRYGRKFTIILNAFLFMVGALVLAFSSEFVLLLAGRFILGFAVSLSAIAECIYISEISTPEKRGMLVSLNELAITVGILISFLVNYIFATVPGGWRIMFGLSSVVAVLQGLAMLFLPKTPQFLMISRQEEKAEQTLRRLQITRNVRQTMTNIRLALAEESSQSFVRVLCDNSDNIGSRLFIGFGLVFFQQFTGQPNIIYYASDIFKQVGFCSEMSSTLASVGLGSMKVASTAVSLVLVDRIGRRKALVSGISVMTVSVLILTAFAFYQLHVDGHMHQETCSELDAFKAETNLKVNSVREHLFIPDSEHNSTGEMDFTLINATATGDCPVSKIPPGFRYLAFAALIGYVCAYSFSFGPIVWVLLSEIFPAALKGRAMALATAGNWLGNVVVSATFIQATAIFTLGGVFLFYFSMCLCSIVFVCLIVPETKNKSLEDISKELKAKNARSLIRDNMRGSRRRNPPSSEYSPLHYSI